MAATAVVAMFACSDRSGSSISAQGQGSGDRSFEGRAKYNSTRRNTLNIRFTDAEIDWLRGQAGKNSTMGGVVQQLVKQAMQSGDGE